MRDLKEGGGYLHFKCELLLYHCDNNNNNKSLKTIQWGDLLILTDGFRGSAQYKKGIVE